tara:strand:+ start:400 stop:711 length:312 start_codon:yes stop_codon:yes gene_type:complete
MGNKSLIILDYGEDCWKQYGVTEQYHLRSWKPHEKWSTPRDCVGSDSQTTFSNLGSYHSIASANSTYGIKTIANAVYDYDENFLHTSGRIYWYDSVDNVFIAI